MDEKLSIRINIGDRFYPLTIEREDEEQIREAAKTINDKIAQYKQRYKEKDIIDFLSMTSLQFAIKSIEKESDVFSDEAKDEIRMINKDLKTFINKNK